MKINKLITASKPTTCSVDHVPTKLLKELFPVAQLVEHGASNAKIMGSIPRESKS